MEPMTRRSRRLGPFPKLWRFIERARGALNSVHQLIGHADLLVGEACDKLRDAGHEAIAERLDSEIVGRNVLYGRWTFQIVEEFDDNYWLPFRDHERRVRDELQGGVRHLFEVEMKERRRSTAVPVTKAVPRPSVELRPPVACGVGQPRRRIR
jgi:hypothetical protein